MLFRSPGHYERMMTRAQALKTEGDGYCALHAVFGHSVGGVIKHDRIHDLKGEIGRVALKMSHQINTIERDDDPRSMAFFRLKKDILALTYSYPDRIDDGYFRTLKKLNLAGRIRLPSHFQFGDVIKTRIYTSPRKEGNRAGNQFRNLFLYLYSYQ